MSTLRHVTCYIGSNINLTKTVSRRLIDQARQMASSALVVKHDDGNKDGEFFIQIEGGALDDKAVLQYQWVRPGVMDMYHTGVPPAFRGKGVAKVLVQHAMDYVLAKNVNFIPSCSYIEKFVNDNPSSEFTKLVLKK